jgi:hypothetical protein
MSSDFKNLFIPVNSPSGLDRQLLLDKTSCVHSRSGPGLDGGCTVEDDDSVGKVRSHDEIVLDDESGALRAHDKLLDHLTGDNTLFRVEISGGLVDKEDIGGYTEHKDDSDSLQLSSGQTVMSTARAC